MSSFTFSSGKSTHSVSEFLCVYHCFPLFPPALFLPAVKTAQSQRVCFSLMGAPVIFVESLDLNRSFLRPFFLLVCCTPPRLCPLLLFVDRDESRKDCLTGCHSAVHCCVRLRQSPTHPLPNTPPWEVARRSTGQIHHYNKAGCKAEKL